MLNKEDIFAAWGIKTLSFSDNDRASIRSHMETIIDFWRQGSDATWQELHSDSTFCLLYIKGMFETALVPARSLDQIVRMPYDIKTLNGFFYFYTDKFARVLASDGVEGCLNRLRGHVEATGGGYSGGVLLSQAQSNALGYACNVVTMHILAQAVQSEIADLMALEFRTAWPRVQSLLAHNVDEPRSRL